MISVSDLKSRECRKSNLFLPLNMKVQKAIRVMQEKLNPVCKVLFYRPLLKFTCCFFFFKYFVSKNNQLCGVLKHGQITRTTSELWHLFQPSQESGCLDNSGYNVHQFPLNGWIIFGIQYDFRKLVTHHDQSVMKPIPSVPHRYSII